MKKSMCPSQRGFIPLKCVNPRIETSDVSSSPSMHQDDSTRSTNQSLEYCQMSISERSPCSADPLESGDAEDSCYEHKQESAEINSIKTLLSSNKRSITRLSPQISLSNLPFNQSNAEFKMSSVSSIKPINAGIPPPGGLNMNRLLHQVFLEAFNKDDLVVHLHLSEASKKKEKNKVFEDGVLILKEQYAELQRDNGQVVCKSNARIRPTSIAVGASFHIGSNECEILKSISEDEYISKGLDHAAARSKPKSSEERVLALSYKKTSQANLPGSKLVSEYTDSPAEKSAVKYSIDPSRHGAHVIHHPVGEEAQIVVDPVLGTFLKPHQVEGVRFLFKSLNAGLGMEIQGCILADEMGLGKTLQTITLVWTLLKQSLKSAHQPTIKKALIVCPSSLVFNWTSEFKKWLGDQRLPIQSVNQGGASAEGAVNDFVLGNVKKVCVISYEMVRRHIKKLKACSDLQLLVCDEGHRLKNIDGNATIESLNSLPCKRRILLSGTPVQNDLDEFYAMVNFVSPGLLGDARSFRLLYAESIVKSRDKSSSEDQKRIGHKRLKELTRRTAPIILRRTSEHIAAQLPPKVECVVFCSPSCVQGQICRNMFGNLEYRKAIEGGSGQVVLSLISKIAKVLNHPDLLLLKEQHDVKDPDSEPKYDCIDWSQFLPQDYEEGLIENSGKFNFLFEMLSELEGTEDRIVIVSNYTTTLRLLEKFCLSRNYPTLRLDGSTEIQKRAEIVNAFNSPMSKQFIFLLSSKAGGCGLNLIGANRIVLLDPSWNPAHDNQAMARVWRFGQTKKVFIYRLITTGTMEEKIFQKQIKKGEFEQLVVDQKSNVMRNFEGDIRDIFLLRSGTVSDTYDVMWKKVQDSNRDPESSIIIAGYLGSLNAAEAARRLGDCEFSAAAARVTEAGVTFLLCKEQTPEACPPASHGTPDRAGGGVGPDAGSSDSDAEGATPATARRRPAAGAGGPDDSDGDDFRGKPGARKRPRVRVVGDGDSDGG